MRRNNRSVWTNLGTVALLLAVILLFNNIRSVFNTPGWQEWGFFNVLFDTHFTNIPPFLSYLIVFGPFPLLVLGIVFLVVGRGKDKEKAAAAAQQQAFLQQPYGQAGAQPGAPVQPGQPYGQAPVQAAEMQVSWEQQGQAPQQPGQAPETRTAGEQTPGQQNGQQGNPPYGQIPPLS